MGNMNFLLLGLIFLGSGTFVDCQGELLTPNVALRGNATQSTTYTKAGWAASPFVASYANDGSTEAGMTRTNMACSRTSNIPPVWWQVDLQKVYDITKVAITHWNYGLQDFFIDVSNNSDGSSAQLCAYDSKPFAPGETRVYTCPCGLFGRYVRIRFGVARRDKLRLCEVQVQAGENPASDDQENNKNTTENSNDGLVLSLATVASFLGGMLVSFVAVFLCKRQGFDPYARFEFHQSSKNTSHNYEEPNVSPPNVTTNAEEGEYAELDDLDGYERPIN